jgi:hypothetical protein
MDPRESVPTDVNTEKCWPVSNICKLREVSSGQVGNLPEGNSPELNGTPTFLPQVGNTPDFRILQYSVLFRSRRLRLTTVGIRRVDYATPSIRKSWR